ncbi:MAG: DUF2254 domain-containing protein [Pseudomonadota bacterium]|nr:DUF2254 domain-containing protein [Pseudomonadota bacterium]
MTTRLQWLLLQFVRKLWVRATAFSVLAVGTALLAVAVKRYIPADLSTKIGANAVDSLLSIVATSMLTVTVFSLSTLVAALGSATSNVTPRATHLLTQDNTAQNALATFVGAFLFSLVGIIALQTGLYGSRGRVVLYVVTLAVIALVVGTLLKWIDHVSKLGRVGETTGRVEDAATKAMKRRHENPYLGAAAFAPEDCVPDGAVPVFASRMGYVEHIDMEALAASCDEGRRIYVNLLPGGYADPDRPLACICGPCDPDACDDVRSAFSMSNIRSFDQDPRFGASVLSEIASRALSPAVNDPGTAIDVLGRAGRVLAVWASPPPEKAGEVKYPRVYAPPVLLDDLFDDVFTPIARDGASTVEVAIRLQKTLRTLSRLGDGSYRAAALRHSALALERCELALTLPDDLRRVREVAAEIQSARG